MSADTASTPFPEGPAFGATYTSTCARTTSHPRGSHWPVPAAQTIHTDHLCAQADVHCPPMPAA